MLSAIRAVSAARYVPARAMSGSWGEGAGHGGGSGGSIRDAGGAFGKREAAMEEKYFRAKQEEQLKSLKEHMHNEIEIHEQSIKTHMEAIERHKQRLHKLAETDKK